MPTAPTSRNATISCAPAPLPIDSSTPRGPDVMVASAMSSARSARSARSIRGSDASVCRTRLRT